MKIFDLIVMALIVVVVPPVGVMMIVIFELAAKLELATVTLAMHDGSADQFLTDSSDSIQVITSSSRVNYNTNLMPVKRIMPRQLEETQVERAMKRVSMPYCVIIVAIIFFALNVSYETYDDMKQKFSITEAQSKNCMVDFQRMGCRPLNTTSEC